jgi:hypothetical protein
MTHGGGAVDEGSGAAPRARWSGGVVYVWWSHRGGGLVVLSMSASAWVLRYIYGHSGVLETPCERSLYASTIAASG